MATSPAPLSKTVIFTTSGMGGCLGWAIVHPANTLAVRWNLASMQGKTFNAKAMIKEHGWLSLYDGIGAGLLRQVFYASARFGLFETFRDKLHDYRGKTDFAGRVVVGATTGGIAAYISCPMEVATVRMSNDASLPKDQRRNYKTTRLMRGGVLTMLAVFVAVSSAFSPTTLAPRSAVSLRVRSVPAPVAMAGWNDEYQTDNPGRKKQVLKTEKTDFDAEMARTGKLGGMDSAPPAFIGLSLFVVAYLVYLVVAA